MRTLTERFARLMSELMGEWPGVGMLAGMSSPFGELEEFTQTIPLVVVLVTGFIFYQLGATTRERLIEVPLPVEAPVQPAGEVG